MERFRELKAYFQKYNTFTLASKREHKYGALFRWVYRQRQLRFGKIPGRAKLPKHRLELLDSIGFPWKPRKEGGDVEDDDDDSSLGEEREDDSDDGSDGEESDTTNNISNPDREQQWLNRYEQAKDYYKKYGSFGFTEKRRQKYNSLYNWMRLQRQLNVGLTSRGSIIKPHRKKLLDKIGFNWSTNSNDDIQEQTRNDCHEDDSLASFSNGEDDSEALSFSEEDEEKGQEQDTGDKRWMDRYEELKAYHKKYGTFGFGRGRREKYRALYNWVIRQRRLENGSIRRTTLPPGRKKLLNEIGFAWDGRQDNDKNTHEEVEKSSLEEEEDSDTTSQSEPSEEEEEEYHGQQRWMTKYRELKAYHKRYRTWSVHTSKNRSLYDWVRGQRTGKYLRKEQKELLDKIGFPWNDVEPKHSEKNDDLEQQKWMDKIKELKAYHKKYKTWTLQPSKDRALYDWVRCHVTGKKPLQKDKKKLLDEIGFPWDDMKAQRQSEEGIESDTSESGASSSSNDLSSTDHLKVGNTSQDRKWMNFYNELRIFYNKHGHFGVAATQNYQLYQWIYRQRNGRQSMPRNRWRLLKRIDFDLYGSGEQGGHKDVSGDNDDGDSESVSLVESSQDEDDDDESSHDDKSSDRGKTNHIGRSIKFHRKHEKRHALTYSDADADDEQSVSSQGSRMPKHKQTKKSKMESKEELWMDRYEDLKRFYKKHGAEAVIPMDSPGLKTLNYWVRYQKAHQDTMSKKRRGLLDRIGFVWENLDQQERATDRNQETGYASKSSSSSSSAEASSNREESDRVSKSANSAQTSRSSQGMSSDRSDSTDNRFDDRRHMRNKKMRNKRKKRRRRHSSSRRRRKDAKYELYEGQSDGTDNFDDRGYKRKHKKRNRRQSSSRHRGRDTKYALSDDQSEATESSDDRRHKRKHKHQKKRRRLSPPHTRDIKTELPADQVEAMEHYLAVVESEIRNEWQQLGELESIAHGLQRVLKKVEPVL